MQIPDAHPARGGRSAFRDRLYELGRRVELLGPHEVRDEVLAELSVIARGGQ